MLQRKTLKLRIKEILHHSIPISKSRNKQLGLGNRSVFHDNLRYVSSGIPLASIVALLFLSLVLINPVVSESFALEDGAVQALDENEDKIEADVAELAESEMKEEINETETSDVDLVGANDEIVTLADVMPTATLTITPGTGGNGGGVSDVTTITPGTTAYRSHNVAVSVKDATNYVLQLNSNTTTSELKLEGGNFTLSGASGQTGTNLADYTWGFAWGATTATDSVMNYYALPLYGTTGNSVSTGRLEAGDGSSVNFTKKLVFAAKFGVNALVGHYKASAVLSLAAAPLGVTRISEMTHMQQMTSEICANSDMKESKTGVIDIRDNSTYTITKLDDNKCWMTTNLRLVDKVITKDDSDITENFTVPAKVETLSSSTWGTDNTMQKVYYPGNITNGAYYSWCLVTAGSCSDATTTDTMASSSICPKGWRLPTINEYSRPDGLLGKAEIANSSVGSTKIHGSPYNFMMPGYVFGSSVNGVDTIGRYWSSTPSGSDSARYLSISDSGVSTDFSSFDGRRSNGLSVRCVAK